MNDDYVYYTFNLLMMSGILCAMLICILYIESVYDFNILRFVILYIVYDYKMLRRFLRLTLLIEPRFFTSDLFHELAS